MTGPKIIAGLDIGTTKVCVLIAEIKEGTANVLGTGRADSSGVRKGIIVDADAVAGPVKAAIREAEAFSGTKIKSVYAGISGGDIRCFKNSGVINIRDKEVRETDVERAIESAGSVYLPLDREALHVLPAEFELDGRKAIADPTGMSGVRLEAMVNIITAPASSVQNLLECCVKAGIDVNGIVLNPLASAYSALTGEEKEKGAVLVDIGGGTTEVVFFKGGCLRHVSIFGVGGLHITNDIAIGLKVSSPEAEMIKKESGTAVKGKDRDGGTSAPAECLYEIIRPRCEEIIEMIRDEIRTYPGHNGPGCRVVLTGGASLLKGFGKLSESMLGMSVRTGRPLNIRGLRSTADSPGYSAVCGLVSYASEDAAESALSEEIVAGIFRNMKERFSGVFRYMDFKNPNQRKEGGVLCLKLKK